jgi:hypothetical protein
MEIVTEQKVLTPDELQTLKNIQNDTQSLISELGEIELIKIQLDNRKEECKITLSKITEIESTFKKELHSKYGDVNINPTTGEITS